ncbi:MAG: STAS domain-containing protein [Gammaproteobacteria bacterium]|nr:STAS domain-containing protein [Gammaproteobacteria bacterium]
MSINTENQDSVLNVTIDGDLTIYNTGEYRESLLAQYDEKKNIELNLSAVDVIDISGLQLIIALQKTVIQAGYLIFITDLSDAVKDVLNETGLTDDFARMLNGTES